MAIFQDRRILRVEHHNNFAMGLGSVLGKKLRSAAGSQTEQQGKGSKREATLEAAQTANGA
jgi:hypothetical protein